MEQIKQLYKLEQIILIQFMKIPFKIVFDHYHKFYIFQIHNHYYWTTITNYINWQKSRK